MAMAGALRRWQHLASISQFVRLTRSCTICSAGKDADASATSSSPPSSPSQPISSVSPPSGKAERERTSTGSADAPQDRNKLLVLGGSGFVGSHVCKEALHRGLPVMSLSRSGKPAVKESWTSNVTWIQGNLFAPEQWKSYLDEVSAVISCVGGFGSNETMRKLNGDANIAAIDAAHEKGVRRFVYISAADMGLPSFFLRGYYEGKRAAEHALQTKFPYGGVILRPGFIHGTRHVGNMKIPLSILGSPLEMVLRNVKGASQIPVIGSLLVPPVNVTAVAKTALRAAVDNAVPPGVLDVWSIIRLGDA